jgi:hypothetical protein
LARVDIKIGLTGAQQVQAGLKGTNEALKRIEATTKKLGDGLARFGNTLTVGVTLPLALVGGAAIKMAADAAESESLFEVSMGNMADAAREFSEDFGKGLGLNRFEMRRTIGVTQNFATAMGLTEEAAFALSKAVSVLTADFSSFFDVAQPEAFLKISAALSGEVEPMKRWGVVVNETSVEMELLNRGLIEQNQELTESQKVLGRFLTIMTQTRNAQGDLARTIDSPTNQFRILQNRVKETGIELGQTLLPVMKQFIALGNVLVQHLAGLIEAFQKLTPAMQGAVIAGLGFALLAGPMARFIGGFLRGVARMIGVIRLFTVGMTRARLVTITTIGIIGSLAIVAGIIALKWEKFEAQFEKIWLNIELFVRKALKNIVGFFTEFLNFWSDGINFMIGVANQLGGSFDTVDPFGKALDDTFKMLNRNVEGTTARIARLDEVIATSGAPETLGAAFTQAFDELKEDAREAVININSIFEGVGEAGFKSTEDMLELYSLIEAQLVETFQSGTAFKTLLGDMSATGKKLGKDLEAAMAIFKGLLVSTGDILGETTEKTRAAFVELLTQTDKSAEAMIAAKALARQLAEEFVFGFSRSADEVGKTVGAMDTLIARMDRQLELTRAINQESNFNAPLLGARGGLGLAGADFVANVEAGRRAASQSFPFTTQLDTAPGLESGAEMLDRINADRQKSIDALIARIKELAEAQRVEIAMSGRSAAIATAEIREVTAAEIEAIMAVQNLTEEEARLELGRINRHQEQTDRIRRETEQQQKAAEDTMARLTDVEFHTLDVMSSMHSATTQFFKGMFTGATTLKDGLKNLFTNIADSILSEFARIAASYVFQVLFGGAGSGGAAPAGAGRQAGGQILASSGGSGLLGSILGGFGSGGGGVVPTLGRGGTIQNLSGASGGFGGLSGLITGGGGTSGIGGLFGALGGGGGIGSTLGFFAGNAILPGIGGPIGSILGSLVGNFLPDIFGGLLGGLGDIFGGLLGGIGSFFGGLFQHGGDTVVTRPTLLGVGEVGPERVSIRPLAGRQGGGNGGTTVVVQGPLIIDEIGMSRFTSGVADGVSRAQSRVL